jgi:arginase
MPISVVLGRGPQRWVDAAGATTGADRVWIVGPRDLEEALTYGHPDPSEIPGLSFIDADTIRAEGAAVTGTSVAEAASAGDGYWVHLDVDVLDQAAFPATDYLMDGGLEMTELVDVLRPLLARDALAGFSIGCYNPDKDPGRIHGASLADALRASVTP